MFTSYQERKCSRMMWVLGVLFCHLIAVRASCDIDKSVINQTERNLQTNLLQKLKPIFGVSAKDLTDVNGNKYEFTVCEGVSGQSPDVGMVMTKSGNKPVVLGKNSRALVSSQDNWLMLTLLGGENYTSSCNKEERKAHIMFVCDRHQAELEIHTVEMLNISSSCYLLFVAGHKSICAPTPESGLSGGSIFLIIVLVTFCAYFTFGFFYLRLVRGAKGIEQIPNREFWFSVGNKLADGCGAVCRCDQYCGAGRPPSSYDGYSPIEERLAQDLQNTDRDSALLSP
ncbi:cation-dependent mannose-6-phosphate receptor-like [Penaeus chinensis]|uniref:cation-dependent mannose-6-phosphate receptor-like n=1 Tax=Penaeus chinensis TaxID=139456 RepID=UPI001FB7DF57|nr:cation-dependent mannose-6-phosphate receptor-like [Penaeus chinensis]